MPVIFAGTFETVEDWIGWALIALFSIGPIAVALTLGLIGTSSVVATTRSTRLFTLVLGFIGSVIGICVGSALYWKSYSNTEALVFYLAGAVIGGACGLLVAAVARLLVRLLRRHSHGRVDSRVRVDG